MRFGSVCSGIEAASVAWGPLGWEAAWFSEIEPFPCGVLSHHYPATPNHGNMTALPARIRIGEIEAPDLLCGGTPCQAFSVAGLRRSLDDDRGNLTLTFVEIADAIDAVRSGRGDKPAIIVWENVPGVLNTDDNAFGCFLAGLAGETVPLEPPGKRWTDAGAVLGPARTVVWRVLDAQYFGLAQRRRRVFVVASARDDIDCAAILFERDGVRRDFAPSRAQGQNIASYAAGSIAGYSEGIGCLRAAGGDLGGGSKMLIVGTLCADSHPGSYSGQDAYTGRLIPFDTTQITSAANRSAPKAGDPCHPLAAGAHAPAIAFQPRIARNGRGNMGELVNALQAQSGTDGRGDAAPCVATPYAVRRLTPRECERLQGFPDDYTAIPYKNKPAEDCPDGPRYKALGNSWAVPVVRWIGNRIQQSTR